MTKPHKFPNRGIILPLLALLAVLGVLFLGSLVFAVAGMGGIDEDGGGGSGGGSAVVTADGHAFPLPRNKGYGRDWLADRCSGTGSGQPHAHGGTDIMHTKNDPVPVYAVVNGTIVWKTNSSIKLQSSNPNDSYSYYYTHLSAVLVTTGASVTVGQNIANSAGYNGGAQGDHTHFSMLTDWHNRVEVPLPNGCSGTPMAEREQLAAALGIINPIPSLKNWEGK